MQHEQVRQLLRATDDERVRLGFLVMYLHGLRVSELCGLRACDVRDGFITVQRLKGSDKTTQQLVPNPNDPDFDEAVSLPAFIARTGVSGVSGEMQIFGGSRQRWHEYICKYGTLSGLPSHMQHRHVLKHSIARRLIGALDVGTLQAYMGHKSGASTMEYLKADDASASAAAGKALPECAKTVLDRVGS